MLYSPRRLIQKNQCLQFLLKYCGHTIAGISLLSDSVMRLVYAINKGDSDNSDYRNQPKAILENNYYADILLPRRSLYIMR